MEISYTDGFHRKTCLVCKKKKVYLETGQNLEQEPGLLKALYAIIILLLSAVRSNAM